MQQLPDLLGGKRTAQPVVKICTKIDTDSDSGKWSSMEAYRSGLGATDAQAQVKAFGSRKCKSHRRILDIVAHAVDTVV